MLKIITPVLLIGACFNVFAEPLKGEAELGFVNTSGNSDTQSINAKFGLSKETENWLHKANLSFLKNEADDETTAEKYNLALQSDRKLDERSFLFIIGNYEEDEFSGFDYQTSVGVGYGYHVILSEEHKLTLEIGPGYRVSAVEDDKDEKETTLRLGELYAWKISETAEFNQYLTVEGGDENTITKAGLSIKSTLTGTLSLRVGIDVKHTDEVPDGVDKTDTETFATISYAF